MADLPTACSLDASALKEKEGLLATLVQRAAERRELPDGLQLRFTGYSRIVGDIAEVVNAERLCCRFLRFTINVESNDGPITLDLTGPPGPREFIGALLDVP
jgi:hypothetical protein